MNEEGTELEDLFEIPEPGELEIVPPQPEVTFTLGPVDGSTLDLTDLDGLSREQVRPQYLTYEQVVRRPLGNGLMFGGFTGGMPAVGGNMNPFRWDVGRREQMAEAARVEVEGFGVGDRVRYVHPNGTNPPEGTEGTVARTVTYRVYVAWDSGTERNGGREYEYRLHWDGSPEYQINTLQRLDPETVEVAPRILINGDRVVYVGPRPSGRYAEDHQAPAYGTQGVVSGASGEGDSWEAAVTWDGGQAWHYGYGYGEEHPHWQREALCHVDDWLDPEFPYRVGMRFYHKFAHGTFATYMDDGERYTCEVIELDKEGGRVKVRDIRRPEREGDWHGQAEEENRKLERLIPVEGQTGVGRREKKMISTCSLMAELEAAEKTALSRWIKGVLDNPTGDNRFPGSLVDKIAVCYQGQLRLLRDERWIESPPYLYVGRADRTGDRLNVSVSHRLAVAMTLMQMVEPSEELKGAARAALGRYLLGEYQELSKGVVVVSKKKPEGLAFSADKVAAKIGDEWVLPTTGEPVKVEGAEWTICSM